MNEKNVCNSSFESGMHLSNYADYDDEQTCEGKTRQSKMI
jgi:hypothetical protein